MNILLAPDAFKDSLTAQQVANAMERGVYKYSPDARCFQLFASDGGEGFLEAVKGYLPELKEIVVLTQDPLGRPIKASYLFDVKHKTAYVELAKASGIELLTNEERNPMVTSTLGTGIQIKHALEKGAKQVYLGIGGSATNDGGMGIAVALGYRFLDAEGNELPPVGDSLMKITRIEVPAQDISHLSIYAVNDVLNPLFGKEGAAYTYAQQKGASPEVIKELDAGLQNLDRQVVQSLGRTEANTPGSGAAGGTAYGLKCFLKAEYLSGTSFILSLSNFKNIIKEHAIDYIITGEGKIDHQTAYGKFVYGMIQAATPYEIPVLGICGKLNLNRAEFTALGLLDAAELYDPTKPPSYSFDHAESLITEKTKQLLTSASK